MGFEVIMDRNDGMFYVNKVIFTYDVINKCLRKFHLQKCVERERKREFGATISRPGNSCTVKFQHPLKILLSVSPENPEVRGCGHVTDEL